MKHIAEQLLRIAKVLVSDDDPKAYIHDVYRLQDEVKKALWRIGFGVSKERMEDSGATNPMIGNIRMGVSDVSYMGRKVGVVKVLVDIVDPKYTKGERAYQISFVPYRKRLLKNRQRDFSSVRDFVKFAKDVVWEHLETEATPQKVMQVAANTRTWFDVEDEEDNKVVFSTREHGSPAYDKPGDEDIKEGRRLLNAIEKHFGRRVKTDLDTQNEFVVVTVTF